MPQGSPNQSRSAPSLMLLPSLLAVAVFARAAAFPFVNWDDQQFIVANDLLHGFSAWQLLRIWTPGSIDGEMLFIPLTYSSLLIDAALGLTPVVVHGINVLLHAVNIVLVGLLLQRLGVARLWAALLAAVFAVHPIQVETVAWAMGRKDLLATLLLLASVLLYLRHLAETPPATRYGALTGVWLLGAAAMLAKPTAVILAPLLLILHWHRYPPENARDWERWGREWLRLLPLLAMAFVVLGIDATLEKEPARQLAAATRLQLLPWIAAGWVKRLMLLSPCSPLYPWPPPGFVAGQLPLQLFAVFLVIAAALALWRWPNRGALTGLAWVAVTAAPALSVVLSGRDFCTADRYGYLPLIGVLLALGHWLPRDSGPAQSLTAVAAAGLVGATSVTAWRQTSVWQSSQRLWQQVIAEQPTCGLAYSNLGLTWLAAGESDRALATLQAGATAAPGYGELHLNLGRLLLDRGEIDAARAELTTAVRLVPGDVVAWRNLAEAEAAAGNVERAVDLLEHAIAIMPDDAETHLTLARMLAAEQRFAAALAHYELALPIAADPGAVLYNIGLMHEKRGMSATAIASYRAALKRSPRQADTWYNLANLLAQGGHPNDAAKAYAQAIAARPDFAGAMVNLGNLMLKHGAAEKAIAQYTRALPLTQEPLRSRIVANLEQACRVLDDPVRVHAALTAALPDSDGPELRQLIIEQGRQLPDRTP